MHLRTVRLGAGLTQNKLAIGLPVRGPGVSEWETGAIEPTFDHLLIWADVLGWRFVIVDGGVVLPSVDRERGEPWLHYERRRLAWPLRDRRERRNLRQGMVADRVGVTRDSVQRWELAHVAPRPISKIVWVHAMGCSLGMEAFGPPDPRLRHIYQPDSDVIVGPRASAMMCPLSGRPWDRWEGRGTGVAVRARRLRGFVPSC